MSRPKSLRVAVLRYSRCFESWSQSHEINQDHFDAIKTLIVARERCVQSPFASLDDLPLSDAIKTAHAALQWPTSQLPSFIEPELATASN